MTCPQKCSRVSLNKIKDNKYARRDEKKKSTVFSFSPLTYSVIDLSIFSCFLIRLTSWRLCTSTTSVLQWTSCGWSTGPPVATAEAINSGTAHDGWELPSWSSQHASTREKHRMICREEGGREEERNYTASGGLQRKACSEPWPRAGASQLTAEALNQFGS